MLSYIYNKTGKKCGLIIFKVVHAGMRAKSDNFHVYNIANLPNLPNHQNIGGEGDGGGRETGIHNG